MAFVGNTNRSEMSSTPYLRDAHLAAVRATTGMDTSDICYHTSSIIYQKNTRPQPTKYAKKAAAFLVCRG